MRIYIKNGVRGYPVDCVRHQQSLKHECKSWWYLHNVSKQSALAGRCVGDHFSFKNLAQTLQCHLHMYAVMPDGALVEDEQWKQRRRGFLLLIDPLSRVFCEKFIVIDQQSLQSNKVYPQSSRIHTFAFLVRRVNAIRLSLCPST
jgi:hypothetical protein